jgi:hypothetical protein
LPTDEEIDIIRDFAPELFADGELTVVLRNANIMKKENLRSGKISTGAQVRRM